MSNGDVQLLIQHINKVDQQIDRVNRRLDDLEGHVRRLRDGYDKINGQVSEIHAALFGPNIGWNFGDGLIARVESLERTRELPES